MLTLPETLVLPLSSSFPPNSIFCIFPVPSALAADFVHTGLYMAFRNALIIALILAAGTPVFAQKPAIPEWTRGAIWYQILIDRFCNGDQANDPDGKGVLGDSLYQWRVSPWTGNWYDLSIQEKLYNKDFYPNAFLRQYGGDYAGILKRVGYLKNLGVGALMLSPVFSATSSHKYDVNSLHHTCKHFGRKNGVDTTYMNREVPDDPKTWYFTGADRDFLDMVKALHDSGLKVVIDAQLVHTSPTFWAFDDLVRNQEKSRFAAWFGVKQWDKAETPFESEFSYDALWDVKAFPRFKTDTLGLVQGPRDYVFAATKRWMDPDGDGNPSDGIDGWRIVLTHWLPERFWVQWTALVKSINPNAVIIAEWSDPAKPAPGCFDIVYTKNFARAVDGTLVTHDLYPTQFDELLTATLKAAKDPDAGILIVGDMETDRLASQCANPQVPFEFNNTPQRNPYYVMRKPTPAERRLQRQALMLQFCVPGAPLIYYGDEAGMWGGDDPDNRKPMLWFDSTYSSECTFSVNGDDTRYPRLFDSTVYSFYRKLIALREKHISLQYGAMNTIIIDDVKRMYAFRRESGADKVWILVNAGDTAQECNIPLRELPNGTRLVDVFADVDFYVLKNRLACVLPPRTVSVLVPAW